MKWVVKWVRGFFWMVTILVIVTAMLFFFALQSSTHINSSHVVDAQTAHASKQVVNRFVQSIQNQHQPVVLSASQPELNGLNAIFHRAFPQLSSDITINKTVLIVKLSAILPLPDFIKYLNITGTVYPSNYQILLGDINIGGLSVSGTWLLNVAKWSINTFIQKNLGDQISETIQWLKLTQNNVVVSIKLPEDLHSFKDKGKSGLLALRDEFALFGDVKHVQFYYHSLLQHVDNTPNQQSLAHYVGYMFQLANEQSLTGVEITAVNENYAALTALALYFGSDKFELLVGDVAQLSATQKLKRTKLRSTVTLAKRVDLQKHFVYSVALQLFGTSSASDALGEMKEFLDSNSGGSGFSFADLLADRAGTRLAKYATGSERSAVNMQTLLAGRAVEAMIMPQVVDLPEGLTAESFKKKYHDVNSSEYQGMLALIDQRIAMIKTYQ